MCAVVVLVATLAFGEGPPTVNITVDGVTYQDVHFGQVRAGSVDVFHSQGVCSIPLEKLPPEIQKQLGYRPKKVAKRPEPPQKPPEQKPPEQKALVRTPPEQKPPEQKPPERKRVERKPPVKKPPEQKSPELKPKEEKPPEPKRPIRKPPERKVAVKKAPVRNVEQVPDKRAVEEWLKENDKKVWLTVWCNYDEAEQQTNAKYNATSDSERWRNHQDKLWAQYNAELCKELGISQAQLRRVIEKGYRQDWPIGNSPEDKVRIANEAGVKPSRTNGSVAEVVSYLNENLSTTQAIEYVQWSPPLLEDSAQGYCWTVEVKYRAKNAEGAPVTETGTAYIRHNKVVDFKLSSRK